MSARWERVAPWLLAAAAFALLATTAGAPMPVGVFYDDGIYFDLARALASGAGYHHLALPGAPAGVHYPPLYPAWLVAWGAMRPPLASLGTLAWLKIGNALLAALSIVPWTRWGARRLGLPLWLAGAAAVTAILLVPARAVTSTLFSEPLAWLLLGITFDLADHADDAPAPSLAMAIGVAALASLLPLVRTILVPVMLAVAWNLATERAHPARVRRREAAIAAFVFLPLLAWVAWTRQHAHEIPEAWIASYGSYTTMWTESVSSASDLAALAAHQIAGLWRVAVQLWWRGGAPIGIAFTLIGLALLRGVRSVSFLSTLGYFAILLVWPISPDRFLWGVLPLLSALFAAGAYTLWRSLRSRDLAWLPLVVALILVPAGSCARLNERGYLAGGWIVPQRSEVARYAPVVQWAATLPREAIILSANDPLIAQATGLHSAPLLTPDLRETRGAPPARSALERATASACAAQHGWMVATDTLDEAGVSIATLRATNDARVVVDSVVHLDGARVAAKFHCVNP